MEFLNQRKQFLSRIEYRKSAKICRLTGQLLKVGLGEPSRITLRATIGKKLGGAKKYLASLIKLCALPLFTIAFYQLGITPIGPNDHTDAQIAVFAGLEEKVIHSGAAAIVGRRNPRSRIDHTVTTHSLFILRGRRFGTNSRNRRLGCRAFQHAIQLSVWTTAELTAFRIRRLFRNASQLQSLAVRHT